MTEKDLVEAMSLILKPGDGTPDISTMLYGGYRITDVLEYGMWAINVAVPALEYYSKTENVCYDNGDTGVAIDALEKMPKEDA